MRSIDPKWEAFYEELDYDKRKELLKEIESQNELTEEEKFAKRLFEERYSQDGEIDNFMRHFLEYMFIYRFRGIRKRMFKNAVDLQEQLFVKEAKERGEGFEDFLYWELRNTAKRYLSTKNDPSYNKKLFGTIASSQEERSHAIVVDMMEISFGAAHKTGALEEMKLYCEALEDAVIKDSPEIVEYLDTIKENILKEIEKKRFKLF